MKGSEASSTATRPSTSRDTCGASPPETFRLTGRTPRLDPRTHAFRPDIADISLAGQLFAPHYARAEVRACTAEAAMVRAAASHEGSAVSQLVHGEGFAVLDRAGGWAWGRCLHDDYVGYVAEDALAPPIVPTHRVHVATALIFARADIKAPVIATRPIGARVAGVPAGEFVALGRGFVHRRHVRPVDDAAADPVAVAERLLGAPYLWGGRGGGGIDCSGLVQVALGFAGIAGPRDSDQQQAGLGRPLAPDEPSRRGDLVFFPGHVGLMMDEARLVHANAHWMAVTAEPLADVVERLRPLHAEPISARRRIEP